MVVWLGPACFTSSYQTLLFLILSWLDLKNHIERMIQNACFHEGKFLLIGQTGRKDWAVLVDCLAHGMHSHTNWWAGIACMP